MIDFSFKEYRRSGRVVRHYWYFTNPLRIKMCNMAAPIIFQGLQVSLALNIKARYNFKGRTTIFRSFLHRLSRVFVCWSSISLVNSDFSPWATRTRGEIRAVLLVERFLSVVFRNRSTSVLSWHFISPCEPIFLVSSFPNISLRRTLWEIFYRYFSNFRGPNSSKC